MFLPTAKDVGDAIWETYSDVKNASQIFEIKTRLWQIKQGDREVTEYNTEMLGLWQDLDLSCEEEWEYTGDSVRFKKKMENERVFEFLAGLNRELDDVRSRVLNRRSLPSIREVFSEVQQKESMRRVMLDLSFGPEGSALLTHGPHRPHATAGRGPHAARTSGSSPRQSKRTYCEHCKKLGHTKDTCWALHGKPANWKPKQPKAHSHQASTETQADKTPTEICQSTSSLGFNSDQLAKLYELFSNFQASGQSSTTLSSGSLAKKSIFFTALSTMSQTTPWIIDSSASDHMIDAHHLFSAYSPCAGNLKVKITDGTLSPVASKGSIRISESITLNPVLHDLSSGKTIGSVKEHEGLYYFDETDVLGQCSPTVYNSASYPKDNELLLWHKRMGHPNFQPSQFWGDFILTATYLINRMPSWVLSFVTSLQKFQEFFPHSRLDAHLPLHVFGSTVFVHTHRPKRNKFDPRALKCVFLGYSSTQKDYKCYDPVSKKLYVSLDVTFF
ncbi:Retrovirus-related Pol polyprotein from transposon TNT 1-94 [Vitis vinifera]|uniref:Retrovirus-related Pol polyprotein from transposon TNT 1-94 n=1 Tax=Vitis vinifera TaxID=29760 RepID=A0A438HPE1_VITVI|nr:Retrovirus-related Pol polyprotein from transposon TNT 1-94 [Vitis vinifera]